MRKRLIISISVVSAFVLLLLNADPRIASASPVEQGQVLLDVDVRAASGADPIEFRSSAHNQTAWHMPPDPGPGPSCARGNEIGDKCTCPLFLF
jgi:hypothetical protein